MCETCGCGDAAKTTAVNLQTGKVLALDGESYPLDHHEHPPGAFHAHEHEHEHVHADGTRHAHPHDGAHHHHHHDAHEPARHSGPSTWVQMETRLLAKNDALAGRNRAWLAERNLLALNLMGAPGAGKTALLERTIRDTGGAAPLFVLEGDQATLNDGERIRAAGAPVVQVNTGTGCHLDADMVARGLEELNPGESGIVVVENVGNLVCPALFDLGERRRVVVVSVTEGDDKPAKYPHMFRVADIVLVNKVDLLPYVDFDLPRASEHARSLNPDVAILPVSARSGEGLEEWYDWLRRERRLLDQSAVA